MHCSRCKCCCMLLNSTMQCPPQMHPGSCCKFPCTRCRLRTNNRHDNIIVLNHRDRIGDTYEVVLGYTRIILHYGCHIRILAVVGASVVHCFQPEKKKSKVNYKLLYTAHVQLFYFLTSVLAFLPVRTLSSNIKIIKIESKQNGKCIE